MQYFKSCPEIAGKRERNVEEFAIHQIGMGRIFSFVETKLYHNDILDTKFQQSGMV